MYFGQSDDIKRRFRRHKSDLRNNKHINTHLQNAWNKYGEKKFEFKVLEIVESTEVLGDLEKKYIKENDSFRNGYNRTPGGESGYTSFLGKTHTEESRMKMRLVKLGKKMSEETKAKMSKNRKGFAGPHSIHSRKIMSQKAKGRTFSKETIEKMRQKRIGVPLKEETKKKLSIAHKGKILSEDTKRKISEAKQKKFTDKQADEIKTLIEKNVSFRKIGKMFGCSYMTIIRHFKN